MFGHGKIVSPLTYQLCNDSFVLNEEVEAAFCTLELLRISFLIHLGILSFFPFLFSLLIRL